MRHIVSVLLNHGFGDLVERLQLGGYVRWGQRVLLRRKEVMQPLSRAQRIRMALEELGPTFVKFGQVLSTRPDLIPDDVIAELGQLREHVPPFDGQVAAEILARELGSRRSQLIDFDSRPLAAGSLAQVHRAVFVGDGTPVAVKIQRPGIREEIESDVALMEEFATLMERYIPESRVFDPSGMVKHFERVVRRELNLHREARTLDEFRRLFHNDATLQVPRVWLDLSAETVLVMQFVDGYRVDQPEELKALGINCQALAANGARIFLKQAFELGVFHGDPHPGNIRVMPDGAICLLDYGMIGLMGETMRDQLIDLLLAIARKDVNGAVQVVRQLGRTTRDELDLPLLDADVRDFIDNYYGVELGQLNVGALLTDFVRILTSHGIVCPGDLMLLIRALVTLEGVGRTLDPDFNLAEVLQPFVESAVRQRYSPGRVARELLEQVRSLATVASRLPVNLQQVMEKLGHDDLRIQLELRRMDHLVTELDRSSNRVVISVILAALIMASALIYRSGGIGSWWLSAPVFIASTVLGAWLIYGVFRSGRL